MHTDERDARQSIIDITKAMLEEFADVEKITVRQIAERAGVGVGLIGYHFKSKNNLLSIAIGNRMVQTIMGFTKTDAYASLQPDVKLKTMMKDLCALAGSDEKLIRFMLLHEITEGSMQAPLYLIPLLKEIFGEQKDDMQLRVIALQILQPIQVAAINPAAFHVYSGVEMSDAIQRNRFIDMLIDNLIHPAQGRR